MDLVKGAVSDQVMGQLGGLLGTDANKTTSVFESAAGSILGGLIKKGSSEQGAKDIFGQIQQQDDSILDKLGDLIGGDGPGDDFKDQGSGILDMVLGGSQQTSSMTKSIAKALGLDEGIVGKLLVLVAPIVMSVIGKYLKGNAMDAVGLGDLLGQQKSHLASVLPASLSNDLGFGDMLGQVEGAVSNASTAVGEAAGNAGDAANTGGSVLKILLPLAILVAAAMYFGPKLYESISRTGPKVDPSDIARSVGSSGFDMDFASVPGLDALGDTGKALTTGFGEITSGLKGLSDDAGATSLAGKIKEFTGKIDGLGLDKFEGAAKSTTSSLVGKFIEAVKGLLAGKSEGIQSILKPVVDALMEKLSPFGT